MHRMPSRIARCLNICSHIINENSRLSHKIESGNVMLENFSLGLQKANSAGHRNAPKQPEKTETLRGFIKSLTVEIGQGCYIDTIAGHLLEYTDAVCNWLRHHVMPALTK